MSDWTYEPYIIDPPYEASDDPPKRGHFSFKVAPKNTLEVPETKAEGTEVYCKINPCIFASLWGSGR